MKKIANLFLYRIVLLLAVFLVTHNGTNCLETDPIYANKCAAGHCLWHYKQPREYCCVLEPGPRHSCDYCSGKEHCERIKKILEIADENQKYQRFSSEDIARYCCDKFKICFMNQYCSECYRCKNAIDANCNWKVEHFLRDACCKRGYGCDFPLYEPDPNNPFDKPCIDWTDGSCLPAFSLSRCCRTFGIACKANVKICPEPEGLDKHWSQERICFEDNDGGGNGPGEIPNCVSPRQWGYCCEHFGVCNKPICDPEFFDNKTAYVTYEAKQQQPEKLKYRVPEVRGYGRVRDG